MKWKQFLKPTIAKIILFIILVLIFGVPSIQRSCQGFVQTTVPPSCIERFTFSNIIIDILGIRIQPLDAVISFSYNPLFVIPYLIILYLLVSLIFHIAGYNWKRALLFTIIGILLIFFVKIIQSVIKSSSFIKSNLLI